MGDLSNTLTRLSTGLRINSAKDDPAGLIASELLKSDIAGTSQAITNIQRGNSMLSTADSAMGNIGSLLTDIKSLVVGAANTGAMNADQINANQLQVNATLEAIDQIATSTTYGGQKILDGSMDFTTNANLTGGLSDVTVSSANFGTGNSIGVNINVLEAAQRGTLLYNGTGVNQRTTLDVTGSVGTKTITFGTAGGLTKNQDIADAINMVSDSTGVQAYVEGQSDSNERLVIEATDVGSDNFVKVAVREGSFDTYDYFGSRVNELRGTDAVATINGLSASAKGNVISLNTPDLALSVKTDGSVGTSGFDITGGGALFQIGPDVVSAQQKRLGIASMMTTAIGETSGKLFQLKSGGSADLTTSDLSRKLADKIVNESISYVANARGRIGAVQSSLFDPMINVLQDQLVALTDAQGSIANADFAEESSRLTSLQLLIQSGMQTLGIANQLSQYAASLVR